MGRNSSKIKKALTGPMAFAIHLRITGLALLTPMAFEMSRFFYNFLMCFPVKENQSLRLVE